MSTKRTATGWWLVAVLAGAFILVSVARWFAPALFPTEAGAGLLTLATLLVVYLIARYGQE